MVMLFYATVMETVRTYVFIFDKPLNGYQDAEEEMGDEKTKRKFRMEKISFLTWVKDLLLLHYRQKRNTRIMM